MIGFDFLRPGLAWLVLFGLLAALVGWLALTRSRGELARWVSARQLARFVPGHSARRARLRVLLGAAALGFLALAVVGPVRGYTYRSVSRKGLDLVLCLDTSRSMLAQDLRPSRLERAKREVVGLLDHLKGDRVALVAFSGDARDVAPLTRDRFTLENLLTFVTSEDNQLGGTDLAAALEHALSLFDGRTGAHEAVVLLTDGEDLEGKGAALAEEASKRNIRVYVVGIGTEAGSKIPVLDADGHQSFLRDPDGKEVVTKLERASLEALARRTGGDYLSAEESPTPLEDLYRARIGRIEGRELEGGERRVPYDRFQWPLALALLCFLGELVLLERAPRRRAERAAPGLAAALLPLCVLGGAERESFQRSLENAVRHQRAGELEAAELAVRSLLKEADTLQLDELQRAEAQFALGVVTATRALQAKDAAEEKALADWQAAAEAFSATRALAGPGELRLNATYDLGSLQLFQAEAKRATIPEISGQAPGLAPQMPPAGVPGSAAPAGEPKDPLKEARQGYLAAKGWFLERLRADWHDADTRADLELIQRRLHELDDIEKKREEQEKQDPQSDPSKDPKNKDQKDKDQKDQKEKPDQDKQDKDKEGQDQKGQDDKNADDKNDEKNQDPKDPSQPQDKQDDKQDPDANKQPDPKAGDAPEEEPKPGAQQKDGEAGEQTPAERVLTREQVMQLLDKLAELEKQQKALEAALRARRRANVKRDW